MIEKGSENNEKRAVSICVKNIVLIKINLL